LDGRKLEEVLREDKKEYQDFRKLWSDIRSRAAALIPKEGESYAGEINLKWND
jgi:hypothetical protein